MRKIIMFLAIFIATAGVAFSQLISQTFQTIRVTDLKDKIAGGWAGKMIGVTYGGPTEFAYRKRINEDSIRWTPADLRSSLTQDDLYVQFAVLSAMDKTGLKKNETHQFSFEK